MVVLKVNQDASKANSSFPPISDAAKALAERIKELNCLYSISKLLENQDADLDWILTHAVELVPAAMQYPDLACACIRLDGREYVSANFRRTNWSRNTQIRLDDRHVGDLDVYYTQSVSSDDGGLFLEEESRLLQAVSERLGKVLNMKISEEAIKESEERYRILTEQVTDGVVLVQDTRFCYVNPAFCRMFNIPSASDLYDSPVNSPAVGDTEGIRHMYKGYTNDGNDFHDTIDQVHCFTRQLKSKWIQVCHSPITFKGQAALLSTFKDITEIKEQQVAAQSMAEQLHDENRVLRISLKERYRFGNILGRSPVMQEVYELIMKAAVTDASVAIFGESGSGKELVAQAIHEHSPRSSKKFVAVNCGAIPESLFEREFFGHRKGAFSSAHEDSSGYLDMVDHGTLFLDEVSELTLNMQAKLLRVIEDGCYRPVGYSETIKSDFRIISASNVSLSEKVGSGQMRNDFYYRLQVIQIRLPPLRQRKEDITLLVDYFLQKMSSPATARKIPGHIMDRLMEYDWPGNVRELRNVIQRYLALGRLEFLTSGPSTKQAPEELQFNLRHALKQLESSMISQALQQASGNRTRAASLLGISRRALSRKIVDH